MVASSDDQNGYLCCSTASHWVSKPSMKLGDGLFEFSSTLPIQRLGLVYMRSAKAMPLEAYVDAAFADNPGTQQLVGCFGYGAL